MLGDNFLLNLVLDVIITVMWVWNGFVTCVPHLHCSQAFSSGSHRTRGQWPYIPASTRAIKVWLDFGSLWGHHSLKTASEVKSDLGFQISDPDYLLIYVLINYMVWTLLAASEVTIAFKQPRRSNLTSYFKSVTPITYSSICISLIWYETFWQPLRSLKHPNSLGFQFRPRVSNQWPWLRNY